MTAYKQIQKYYPYLLWIPALDIAWHYYLILKTGGDPWMTGDWLINYTAGFVRRGGIGHLLYSCTETGRGLLFLTGLVQISIFLAIIAMVILLFMRAPKNGRTFMLLFSPAFLLFPWYELAGGFRKETIVYLAFLTLALPFSKKGICKTHIAISLILFGITALSHEIVLFCVYFFAHILWLAWRRGQISVKTMGVSICGFIVIATTAGVVSWLYPGDSRTGGIICNSILQRGMDLNICSGAIAAISNDNDYWIQLLRSRTANYLINTVILLLLAITPLLATKPVSKNIPFLMVGLCSVIPLFFLGADWGRWLHIYIVFSVASHKGPFRGTPPPKGLVLKGSIIAARGISFDIFDSACCPV